MNDILENNWNPEVAKKFLALVEGYVSKPEAGSVRMLSGYDCDTINVVNVVEDGYWTSPADIYWARSTDWGDIPGAIESIIIFNWSSPTGPATYRDITMTFDVQLVGASADQDISFRPDDSLSWHTATLDHTILGFQTVSFTWHGGYLSTTIDGWQGEIRETNEAFNGQFTVKTPTCEVCIGEPVDYVEEGSGGILWGSSGSVLRECEIDGDGGILWGGRGGDGGAGGLLWGGSGSVSVHTTIVSRGGITWGGGLANGIKWGGSGGVVKSSVIQGSGGIKWSTFSRSHRRKITVPAGQVGGNLSRFVLGVIVDFGGEAVPDHSELIFTDSVGVSLPFEVRSIEGAVLTAFVRTDLATTSNTIWLYYGVE